MVRIMNLLGFPSLPPEQIAAEIAEMRKAAREIFASRRKTIAFLRQVGVIDGKAGNGGGKKKARVRR